MPKHDRPLGLSSATALVIASMIGAGVFTTSGFALADLGTAWRVMAAWTVGGAIALCGAAGYGALAARMTQSGGECLYLSKTVHPWAGTLAGWISIIAGFTGATAFAALALEAYLPKWQSLAGFPVPDGSVAALSITSIAVLHFVGVRIGATAQNVLVAAKFLILMAFLFIAISRISVWEGVQQHAGAPEFSISKFAMSLVWISLAYSGFNAAIYASGEVRDAATTVPRALILGTAVVTVIYLILNAVFLFAPPREAIIGQPNVAVAACATVGGTMLIHAAVVIALVTSLSALVMAGPRVTAQMAAEGVLPHAFLIAKSVPRVGIAAHVIVSLMFVALSNLRDLLSYLGLALSVSAALTVASLFWFGPTKDTARWRKIAAAIYVLATLAISITSIAGSWN